MTTSTFTSRRGSMEDLFFLERDYALIDSLRGQTRVRETTEDLMRATGIHNADVLKDLVEENFGAELGTALAFVPIVEVAWADGEVQPSEREVLLNNLEDCGIPPDSKEYATVEHWLRQKPSNKVLAAWQSYMSGICEQRSPKERQALGSSVMDSANRMAHAHAHLLDLLVGDGTTKEEREMIAQLGRPFHQEEYPVWFQGALAQTPN